MTKKQVVFHCLKVGLALALVATVSAQDYTPIDPSAFGYDKNNNQEYNKLDGTRDSGFSFCNLRFQRYRYESNGSGWDSDFPMAGRNFLYRIEELTKVEVAPMQWVVDAWSEGDQLSTCPFLFTSDVGTLRWQSIESIQNIRTYLLKGGFLWVDDFWGTYAWQVWESSIELVLPGYRIIDIPESHPIYSAQYVVPKVPQIPNLGDYIRGITNERGTDSPTVNIRGIEDKDGNLMVLMSHNTDIADSWEEETTDTNFFNEFASLGYGFGINVMLYVMSH